ncbi:MAG: recombinase family protein [Leptolyngbya sp. UWPOB_LEPTO1]|nr:recombinase family protein [Leptolyngbya sp. UWPOB_LEPTO1]
MDGDLGYARVSSDEQAKGHSVDNQIARLKKFGCTQIWADTESAYKKGVVRPDFEAMLAYIQTGAARGKRLCVTDIDRLARNELRSFWVFELLEEQDIKLVSLDQPYIDLSDPDGRVMAGQAVIQARAYSARLSKRVKQGHQHHRDRNAAYFAPFGYRKIGERFELDHRPYVCIIETQTELSQAEVARELIEKFLEYRTVRRTILWLNDRYGIRTFIKAKTEGVKANRKPKHSLSFSISGFVSWLNNPILRGHLAYGRAYHQRQRHKHLWDIRYNTHPDHRVMSDEEYQEIEAVLDWNSKHGGYAYKTDLIHPFTGLIICGECRGRCSVQNYRLRTDPTIRKFSFQCKNYRMRTCLQKTSIRHDAIEPLVIEALIQRTEEVTRLAELPPSTTTDSPEILSLRAELSFYQSAPGDRAAGIVEDLKQQIEQYQKAQQNITSELLTKRDLLLQVFSDPLYWKTLNDEEKQQIYRALIEKIVVRNGGVEEIILKV